MNDYELVVPFDSDEPEFARGVEVGLLVARLRAEERPVRAVVHARNAEMMFRLAEATGTAVSAVDLDDNWMEATFAEPSW